MRTTVRLDDGLMAEVKRFAARRKKTLTAVIEESLRQTLAWQERFRRAESVRLTTVGGNGVLPRIDLDDTASLLDVMDDARASA